MIDGLLFSGTANIDFSNNVAKHLKIDLASCEIGKFSNGEIKININQSVRKKDCYVIQTTSKSGENSPNDNLFELFILIDALKRGSAKTVNVIIPYYAYSRQDRKDYSRAPISATVVAQFLENLNVDRIIVFDLHAGQIGGFFSNKLPLDNLYVEPFFIKYIKQNIDIDNVIIVAPDEGACKRAVRMSTKINCGYASIFKQRKEANVVDTMQLMGDVSNKIAILVDDIIDTGGTACKAAEILHNNGAKEIYMVACHGLFSGNCIQKINNSYFKKVIVTNTVDIPHSSKKIEIIDVSKLCAEVIKRSEHGESLSELYNAIEPIFSIN